MRRSETGIVDQVKLCVCVRACVCERENTGIEK